MGKSLLARQKGRKTAEAGFAHAYRDGRLQ
jgi:hypothetical protein